MSSANLYCCTDIPAVPLKQQPQTHTTRTDTHTCTLITCTDLCLTCLAITTNKPCSYHHQYSTLTCQRERRPTSVGTVSTVRFKGRLAEKQIRAEQISRSAESSRAPPGGVYLVWSGGLLTITESLFKLTNTNTQLCSW